MSRARDSRRPGDAAHRRTWVPPAPHPDWCAFCKTVAWLDGIPSSCIDFDVRGLPRVPHAWPAPDHEDYGAEFADDPPCQCSTPVGGFHHYGCDIEICPWADTHPDDGEQLLCCGCLT